MDKIFLKTLDAAIATPAAGNLSMNRFLGDAEATLRRAGRESEADRIVQSNLGGLGRLLAFGEALRQAADSLTIRARGNALVASVATPTTASRPAPAPPAPGLDVNALRHLAKQVLGSAALRDGDSLEIIQAKFATEGLRLPGTAASTREFFGMERAVRASRQEAIDRFFKSK